jgi:DNA-binding Lrp family transcriptional regulator
MGFREVSVVEVREVLRAWLEGVGLRTVAERAGVDRKTARRYVEAAQAAGLVRGAGVVVDDAVTDELIGLVVEAVRPVRPNGHGEAWETLLGHEEQIRAWVSGGERDGVKRDPLSIVKIEELLARQGCGCRIGRCTGSPSNGADSAPDVAPRSGSPTATPGWRASSTSPRWACCSTPTPDADGRCTR